MWMNEESGSERESREAKIEWECGGGSHRREKTFLSSFFILPAIRDYRPAVLETPSSFVLLDSFRFDKLYIKRVTIQYILYKYPLPLSSSLLFDLGVCRVFPSRESFRTWILQLAISSLWHVLIASMAPFSFLFLSIRFRIDFRFIQKTNLTDQCNCYCTSYCLHCASQVLSSRQVTR